MTSIWNNNIEYKIIFWNDINFGCKDLSYCGICSTPEDGYFKDNELIEDIICKNCSLSWKFIENLYELFEDENISDNYPEIDFSKMCYYSAIYHDDKLLK